MKQFNWDPEKNQQLIEERGISFEEVVFHLQSDGLLDDIKHPNKETYSHQRIFIVAIEGYAYLVPDVETAKDVFLKTIIPSRKATKQYLGEDDE
ncbi:MAG: BrnT family toxin [Thiogranum sp.]